MAKSIFEYTDYKRYVTDTLDQGPRGGRGSRSALAEYTGCQTAYISQVLNGHNHFSLEQADAINRFFGHSDAEGDFFILLVQLSRAGTPSLREYFQKQIQAILDRRLILKERLEVKKTLSPNDQFHYYSQWIYAATHILITIPTFQSKEAIAKHFGISLKRASEVVDFLVSVGLATQDGSKIRPGATRLHIGQDSIMVGKHHTNWRLQAIQSLDRDMTQDLHYSSVVSMSKADVKKLKSMIIEFVKEAKLLIKDSKEEELHAFCVDFFKT